MSRMLDPRIMNPERTLRAFRNAAKSIDETDKQGPKGLIAARARRCSTCGVVSGFFDEQVPPPLIAWCFRAALFPGGTASMTHPTLTMTCCRALEFIGGGTCFSLRTSPFRPPILGRKFQVDWVLARFGKESTSDFTWRIRFVGDNLTSIAHRRAPSPSDQPRIVNPDDLTVSDSHESQSQPETKLLVSLATYNELGNLQPLVQAIRQFAPRSSILIIDDNSPDGTGKIADELAAQVPEIHVLHRPAKLGLGTAMLEAISFAVGNQYDYLLNLDADFSHPPRFIPALLEGMRDHDVMIGSRYVPGGGVEGGFNFKRKFMSSGINWYARITLGLTSKDNSGAFRCYRVSKLAQIDLSKIRSRGYSFQEEILYWCKRVGCRIGETPILFENRRSGASKINTREAASALWILLQLGLGRVRG